MQDLQEIAKYPAEPEGKPLHFYIGLLVGGMGLLWSKRRYVVRTVAMVGVLSAVFALLLPKSYTTAAYLMPPDSSSSMSGLAMLMGMGGGAASTVGSEIGNMLGMSSPGQLYIRVLQSNTVEDRIIDRFELMKLYQARLRSDARKALAGQTEISEDRKSGVINIEVTDSDPNRAAQIANAYHEELDRLLVEVNTGAARRERQYYEQQLMTAKTDMERAAKELGDFSGKNVAINVPEQGKAAVEAIASVQGQLIAAQAQLKGLLQIYKEGQGPVQSLRAQIAELQRQLAQMGGKQAGGSEVFPDIKTLSALSVPYLNLYQRMKVQQAVVEALSQQYELAKLQESRQVSSIKVLEPAEVPDKKSFPPRVLIVLFCTFMAFCYAATRLFAAQWWETADADDPWKQVLTPVVAWHGVVCRSRPLSWLRRAPSDGTGVGEPC